MNDQEKLAWAKYLKCRADQVERKLALMGLSEKTLSPDQEPTTETERHRQKFGQMDYPSDGMICQEFPLTAKYEGQGEPEWDSDVRDESAIPPGVEVFDANGLEQFGVVAYKASTGKILRYATMDNGLTYVLDPDNEDKIVLELVTVPAPLIIKPRSAREDPRHSPKHFGFRKEPVT